jgi:pimeloyl-ACP methyl ester carboxylesterase
MPAGITEDPAIDRIAPASMDSFQLPSHGALLNALVYVAAGPGPHPAVILLHGFPGNERNLDLAQAIRRSGWDVLFFNYRGSWGSPGDFSFTHSLEDTEAALAYLRSPTNARRLRLDPTRIVLIGHSMGGFNAVTTAAKDPFVLALGMISAANLGGRIPPNLDATAKVIAIKRTSEGFASQGMSPLAGTTPEALARETVANAAMWNFVADAPALKSRPVLIITSDDGLAPANDVLAQALRADGNARFTTHHLATDHTYSDRRIALTVYVLDWLQTLGKP